MGYKLFDMPEGVKAAVKRIASASKRDGVYYVDTVAIDGEVSFVKLFTTHEDFKRGDGHFVTLIDGQWYEHTEFGKGV